MKTGIVFCVFLIFAASVAEEDDDKSKTLYKKMIARRREVS